MPLDSRLSRGATWLKRALRIERGCTTMDCDATAEYEADIYDGVSDTPVVAPYCFECACTLHDGGEDVRGLPGRHQ